MAIWREGTEGFLIRSVFITMKTASENDTQGTISVLNFRRSVDMRPTVLADGQQGTQPVLISVWMHENDWRQEEKWLRSVEEDSMETWSIALVPMKMSTSLPCLSCAASRWIYSTNRQCNGIAVHSIYHYQGDEVSLIDTGVLCLSLCDRWSYIASDRLSGRRVCQIHFNTLLALFVSQTIQVMIEKTTK